MATNKNKDSAALFELLDKSTLKVPKSGSLKIPAWWSSKTNPPATPAAPTPPPAATPVAAPVVAPAAQPLPVRATEPITQPDDPETDGTDPAPAPVRVQAKAPVPAANPSIRPPARLTAPAPVKRPPSNVFAPQTVDQSAPLESTSRGAPPLWLLLAGGGAVVLLLMVVLIFFLSGSKPPTPRNTGTTSTPVAVPPPPQHTAENPPTQDPDPQEANPVPPQQTPQPQAGARVVPFDQIRRVPNAYYLYIFTADEKTALANAQYLADHGISTSVSSTNYKKFYVVVSVDGFARLDDPQAKAFKMHIIELGRSHPDARKARTGVYDTAYFYKIIRQP